ncbi:MAG: ABC transporter ATP-binding protein [Ignavibacteriae bacterium]|nr:MAG: ABC transporter ATP-binding protein [Ignavibacteriota bacterium]
MTAPRKGALAELRRLLPYLRRYRVRVIWGLVFITISNICSTTIPRIVGTAIDTIKSNTYAQEDIYWLIAQIMLLTIGSGLGMFATRRTIIVMSRFVEEDLRNDFLASIQVQAQRFYHDRSTGSLLAHFTNDVGAVREFIGPAIMYTANTVTTFLFALSWMISLNGWLTLAIVTPIPFIAWATYNLGRKIHERYRTVQEQYEHVTTQAQETFSGVRVVRAYAREEDESTRFDQISNEYYRKNMTLARINSLMMPSMTVLFNIAYVIVIGLGGYLVVGDQLTVGELTQFFIYLNQLLWPVAAIGWVTGMIQRGAASIGRLGNIMDAVPDVRNTDTTDHAITSLTGDVVFEHVSLSYQGRADTTVLSDITIAVPAGSSLGILGSVGCGKTSLVNLIPRLYDVTTGAVRIDGADVRNIPLEVLRHDIAVVPQESFLFSDTIRGNIAFGRPDASEEEILHASQVAQLDNDIRTLTQGYDTVVGERGITLSGGQKQRTSLARAILCDPKILILDDALSAVDTDTESRILTGLAEVMKGRTTIIISHRISALRSCDNIVVMQDGKIIEEGDHAELIAMDGKYADTYERQLLEQELS